MDDSHRINWIDNLKGIGIIFIIFGHSLACPEFLINYFFSFHVPLFFFIAGLNFNNKNLSINFGLFCKKRAEKLLVPYFFFNILSYTFWFSRTKILDHQNGIPAVKPLIGILYGNGGNFWLIHNEPLWFFVCLFVTQIVLFFILKIAKTKLQVVVILIICGAIGCLDSNYFKFRLPWSIDVAFTAVVFSGIGYILKDKCKALTKRSHMVFLLVFLMLNISFVLLNGRVDMNHNKYNNILLFYGGAFSGIFFWVSVSIVSGDSRILQYIGTNSLTIFALHLPALIVIVKLLLVIGISYSLQATNILFLFIHAFLAILILVPANYIFNKYTPFLIGRRNISTGVK
jgi:acyltransferase